MKKHRAVITNNQGLESNVDIEVIHLTTKSQAMKSIKLGVGLLLIAALCVLIPVFHFVLVPLFLVLAVVLPFLQMKNDKALTAQTILCPKCQAPISFKTKTFKTDLKNFCSACRSQVKLYLK